MMQDIKDALSYYFSSLFYSCKSWLSYRLSSFFIVLQNLVSLGFTFATVGIIYSVSNGIAGWSYFQLLFLTGIANLTFGVVSTFASPWYLPRIMREGSFDVYLTKPYSKFVLVIANMGFTSYFFSFLATSILVIIYSAMHLQFSTFSLLSFGVLYIVGLVAFVLFSLVFGLLAYTFLKTGDFTRAILGLFNLFSSYPLRIYGFAAQLFFTLLIPIGVAVYYPSMTLLGMADSKYYFVFIAIALLFIVVSYRLFNYLMRFYESGGG